MPCNAKCKIIHHACAPVYKGKFVADIIQHTTNNNDNDNDNFM